MNTFSHLRMSTSIKEAVERNLGIKLDTASFMLGNIKPDFSAYFITIPHIKDKAMNFIASEISGLMNCGVIQDSKCSKKFSERLGVVTHYLSDFFCYAHSSRFQGNLLKHIIYEAELSRYSRKNLKLTGTVDFSKYLSCSSDCRSLCNLINDLHSKYEIKRPSYAKDLAYILKVSTTIASLIIINCMKDKTELAA